MLRMLGALGRRGLLPGAQYAFFGWILFWATLALCVIDRFAGGNGDTVGGGNRAAQDKMTMGNAGEALASIVWALTGRIMIPGQNMLFYSVMWVLPNALSGLFPSLDMRERNIAIHRWVAKYLLCLPVLIHVLVTFMPLVAGTDKLVLHTTTWNWNRWWDPVVNPFKTWITPGQVNLSMDDIFRLCATIFTVCFLLPLSLPLKAFGRLKMPFTTRSAIHFFVAAWISFDMIRKASHRLSHFFNLPFLALWALDRIASIFWYCRHPGLVVSIRHLDDEHAVVHIHFNGKAGCAPTAAGQTYYLLHGHCLNLFDLGLRAPYPQRSHAFSSVRPPKRCVGFWDWDAMFIVGFSSRRKRAWTKWLMDCYYELKEVKLQSWGPYHSPTSCLLASLQRSNPPIRCPKVMLFASGTGCGYLLDLLTHESEWDKFAGSIEVHIACKSRALVDFFCDHLRQLFPDGKCKFPVQIYYTGPSYAPPKTPQSAAPIQYSYQGQLEPPGSATSLGSARFAGVIPSPSPGGALARLYTIDTAPADSQHGSECYIGMIATAPTSPHERPDVIGGAPLAGCALDRWSAYWPEPSPCGSTGSSNLGSLAPTPTGSRPAPMPMGTGRRSLPPTPGAAMPAIDESAPHGGEESMPSSWVSGRQSAELVSDAPAGDGGLLFGAGNSLATSTSYSLSASHVFVDAASRRENITAMPMLIYPPLVPLTAKRPPPLAKDLFLSVSDLEAPKSGCAPGADGRAPCTRTSAESASSRRSSVHIYTNAVTQDTDIEQPAAVTEDVHIYASTMDLETGRWPWVVVSGRPALEALVSQASAGLDAPQSLLVHCVGGRVLQEQLSKTCTKSRAMYVWGETF